MDHETQKQWNAWAEGIARRIAHKQDLAIIDAIANNLCPPINELRQTTAAAAKREKAQGKRMAALEQRIANLEKAITGEKVIEWPLRTGTGG